MQFNRSNSQFDIRNRFVLSYNYEIPFTKHFQGWKRTLLDGWSQSGIFTSQSGLPATVFAAPIFGFNDLLLNGTNNGEAVVNTALDGDATKLHPLPFFNSYTVPTTLPVSEPLLEQDGTSGRNHLRLAGLTDLEVSKLFKITESKSFQLRWESFNALNHPNFNGYQNSFASPLFNTYTTTATNMRQMQVAVKFIFQKTKYQVCGDVGVASNIPATRDTGAIHRGARLRNTRSQKSGRWPSPPANFGSTR